MVSPTLLWWKPDSQLRMEVPSMLMWSSSIPPPGRGSSLNCRLIVTIGSDTSLGRGARAGLDGVNAQLRAREDEKRNHSVVRRLLNEAENNIIFTPIVMSACGAMGPSMVAFLKEVYGRAKEADKFLMSRQPALSTRGTRWKLRRFGTCA